MNNSQCDSIYYSRQGNYNAYWREDSFNFKHPKNWREIVTEANRIIGDVAQDTENCETIERCSKQLWDNFCKTNKVGNVKAIWY